jgi:hypothetical protein
MNEQDSSAISMREFCGAIGDTMIAADIALGKHRHISRTKLVRQVIDLWTVNTDRCLWLPRCQHK